MQMKSNRFLSRFCLPHMLEVVVCLRRGTKSKIPSSEAAPGPTGETGTLAPFIRICSHPPISIEFRRGAVLRPRSVHYICKAKKPASTGPAFAAGRGGCAAVPAAPEGLLAAPGRDGPCPTGGTGRGPWPLRLPLATFHLCGFGRTES